MNATKRHARNLATGSATVWLALVGLLTWASGCASNQTKVHHAVDRKLDPQAYSTYRIVEQSVGTPEADIAIQSRIRQVMQARGYGEDPNAPLLVTYKVLTVDSGRAPPQAAEAGVVGAMGDMGAIGAGGGEFGEDENKLSKLVLIQMLDAKSLRIVWGGWSQAEVPSEELVLRASDAATKILSRVPRRI